MSKTKKITLDCGVIAEIYEGKAYHPDDFKRNLKIEKGFKLRQKTVECISVDIYNLNTLELNALFNELVTRGYVNTNGFYIIQGHYYSIDGIEYKAYKFLEN